MIFRQPLQEQINRLGCKVAALSVRNEDLTNVVFGLKCQAQMDRGQLKTRTKMIAIELSELRTAWDQMDRRVGEAKALEALARDLAYLQQTVRKLDREDMTAWYELLGQFEKRCEALFMPKKMAPLLKSWWARLFKRS